jgi:hypothetical protein
MIADRDIRTRVTLLEEDPSATKGRDVRSTRDCGLGLRGHPRYASPVRNAG